MRAKPAPPGQAANLWVDGNGGRCARAATPAGYRDDAACGSIDAAWDACRPGDEIAVRPGAYGAQTITGDKRAPGCTVTGESASIADLVTRGAYLTLKNMTIPTGAYHGRGWASTGSHIVLSGVRITGPYARVDIGGGARDVTWKNGSLGTPRNTQKRLCSAHDAEPVQLSLVSNVTFSNLDFYPFIPDMGNPDCGEDGTMHLETIRVNDGVDNFRLERSRFQRGDGSNTARLFVTKLAGRNSNNLTVVNNWFGAADGPGGGSYSVVIHPNQACVGYVFAYNQFEQGFDPACSPKQSLKLVGNTGTDPPYACEGTVNIRDLWAWNQGGSCGTDRWVLSAGSSLTGLKYAPDGYHLLSKSPAIDGGETIECMALTHGIDIDGDSRSGICDAGPDEFRR